MNSPDLRYLGCQVTFVLILLEKLQRATDTIQAGTWSLSWFISGLNSRAPKAADNIYYARCKEVSVKSDSRFELL